MLLVVATGGNALANSLVASGWNGAGGDDFGLVGADKEAFGDEGAGSTKTGLTAAHFV